MLRNRLCYLFILLCTAAFYICFNGYYSMYAFLASLALPVLSLAASLPGMLTVRLELDSPEASRNKVEPFPVRLTASTKSPLPMGRAWAALTAENLFTGDQRRERLECTPGSCPVAMEYQAASDTCGVMEFRLSRAWACDMLGLVSLPVRLRAESVCRVSVMPNIYSPVMGLEPEASPEGDGLRYSQQRPGSDPTELFGLREYRPGDRVSRVDWKLSQKTGNLLVREGSLPITDRVMLLAVFDGDGQEVDAVMDVLATLDHFLAAWETGHLVCFPGIQGLETLEVLDPSGAAPAMEAVMALAERGPLEGGLEDLPGGVAHVLYLCAQPEAMALGALRDKYPGGKLTVLHIRPGAALPDGAQPVRVRPGHIAQDLEGLLL